MAPKSRLASFSFGHLLYLLSYWVCSDSHGHAPCVPSSIEARAWQRVDCEVFRTENVHHRYWWKHSGYALGILLYYAGYSPEAQYESLRFFATVIASSLGVPPDNERSSQLWASFMTDDGNPIELSWDWGTGNKSPTIRYSIEPAGDTGTPSDHCNKYATSKFHQCLLSSLPGIRLEWFDHFKQQFQRSDSYENRVQDGHSSHTFYAFDLVERSVTSKAYFFPASKARELGQSNLAAIEQAIASAPQCTAEQLQALSVFCEFAREMGDGLLEFDMLAIDLIDPLESRLKIYFRCRQTDFKSVLDIMGLGGRIRTQELDDSLEDLRRLWNAVFELNGIDDRPLKPVQHRTAGVLYNVEFKLGSTLPTTKIYIPVRHYSSCDENIIQGLKFYMEGRQQDRYLAEYMHAMDSLFSQKAMRASCGLHTYIGWSTRQGSTRIVSYINPQASKLLTMRGTARSESE